MLRKYILPDLIFHIEKCKTIEEAWDKLSQLQGQVGEIRGYKLESDLVNLDPKDSDTIQDYVTKVNELRAQLKDGGIDKKDAQLVFNLLGELSFTYATFISSFHTLSIDNGEILYFTIL